MPFSPPFGGRRREVPGVVERKEPFGLFVRVGSRVGLAHRSELPWPWPAVDTPVAVRRPPWEQPLRTLYSL